MASNISNASDYDSGLSGREGFGYSGDTSNTSYVGDDPSGGEIGLGNLFSPSDFAYMDSIGAGGRTGGRADFGVGYGRSNINTAMSQLGRTGVYNQFSDKGSLLNLNEFMALKGIDRKDPFEGSRQLGFTDYMGGLDYRGQRNTIDDLQRQYSQYVNPYGVSGSGSVGPSKGNPTGLDQSSLNALQKDFDRLARNPNIQGNQEKGILREGLRGNNYGSIFGNNAGQQTAYGNVATQDRQFSPQEATARLIAAATPIGPVVSQLGTKDFTLDTSKTYDPSKDPNSPIYEGTGTYGGIFNALTGGAGTQIGKAAIDKTTDLVTQAKDSFLDFFNKPDAGLDVKQVLSSEQRGKELSEFPQFQMNTGTLPVASPINNVTKTELPNIALASFPELPTQSNRGRAMLSRDILASMNVDNKGILTLPQATTDLINEDGFNTITGEFVPSAFSNVPESFKEDLANIEISAGPANGTKLSPEKEKQNRSYQVYNQIKQLEELQNAIFTNRQDVLPKDAQSLENPKMTNNDVARLNEIAAEIATLELLEKDISKTEPRERFDSSRVNLVPDITGEGFVLENKYRDSTFTPEEIKEMRLQGFQFDDFPTKTNVSVNQLPPYLQKEYYLNTNLDYGKFAPTPLNVVY